MAKGWLEKEYSLQVVAEQEGGYTIFYPDLPGCVTQIETLEELPKAAREIKELWIASALEDGQPIPEPTFPPEHNGKILLRLPKSLHRDLADEATREGVSLNQYLVSLLSNHHTVRALERRIDQLEISLAISRHSRVAD
jgi:predicted RNase H-like HicB family nuclease